MDQDEQDMLRLMATQLNALWFVVNALMTNLCTADSTLKPKMLAMLEPIQSSEPEGQRWIDEAVKLVRGLP
jgi:hypothetical protein